MRSELESLATKIGEAVAAELEQRLRGNPPTISPWLSPEEAARYLGLSERGLETMRRQKRGPKYARIGERIVRYDVRELDAWLRGQSC